MTTTPSARFRAACLAAFASAAIGLSGLSGCKTVDLGSAPSDSTDTARGTAVLRITNKIEQDPDSLVFFQFPGNATDFSNAAGARRIGGVDTGATMAFTVPAGTWKLAYANRAGVVTPMRDLGSDDWLKALLAKGGETAVDAGRHERGVSTTPAGTEPPPHRRRRRCGATRPSRRSDGVRPAATAGSPEMSTPKVQAHGSNEKRGGTFSR